MDKSLFEAIAQASKPMDIILCGAPSPTHQDQMEMLEQLGQLTRANNTRFREMLEEKDKRIEELEEALDGILSLYSAETIGNTGIVPDQLTWTEAFDKAYKSLLKS